MNLEIGDIFTAVEPKENKDFPNMKVTEINNKQYGEEGWVVSGNELFGGIFFRKAVIGAEFVFLGSYQDKNHLFPIGNVFKGRLHKEKSYVCPINGIEKTGERIINIVNLLKINIASRYAILTDMNGWQYTQKLNKEEGSKDPPIEEIRKHTMVWDFGGKELEGIVKNIIENTSGGKAYIMCCGCGQGMKTVTLTCFMYKRSDNLYLHCPSCGQRQKIVLNGDIDNMMTVGVLKTIPTRTAK